MGFEMGFNKIEKYPGATIEDVFVALSYRSWDRWNRPGYKTFDDYMKAYYEEDYKMPSQEVIDFYNREDDLDSDLGFICGWENTELAHRTADHLKKISENRYQVVDRESVDEIIKEIDVELERHKLTPAFITGGITEDGKVVELTKLIVQDEYGDGEEKLFDVSCDQVVFIPSRFFDEDRRNTLEYYRSVLERVKTVDLDKYFVWFNFG